MGIGAKFLAHSKTAEVFVWYHVPATQIGVQGLASKVEKALRKNMMNEEQRKQWDKAGGRDWKHTGDVDAKGTPCALLFPLRHLARCSV